MTTLLLTIGLPITLGYLLGVVSGDGFENILLHAALSGGGGLLAMTTSLFIFIKFYAKSSFNYFTRTATALLVMGTLDVSYALVSSKELFIWLDSTALFWGGLFFMTVWLQEKHFSHTRYKVISMVGFVFATMFILTSLYFEPYLPSMLQSDETFTIPTNILNIIGAFGFTVASLKFIYNYIKTQEMNELLLAGHTLLFAMAELLLVASSLWDLMWWFSHLLRFIAYMSAFYFLYHSYIDEMNELSNTQKKIDEYLDIINKHVIISTTDIEGNLLDVSSAFCKISGYSKEEMIGKDYNILKNNHLSHKKRTLLWETIQSGNVWEGEIEYQNKDGKNYWLDVIITPKFNHDHKIIGFTAIKSDITDKKEIEILSITDTLTQLYNQGYFKTVIEREIKRARRDDKYLAFLILDVDCFKKYNDTYGHQKGDEVLQKIGEVLRMYTKRGSDFAFRLGGEEFGLLFSGLNMQQSHAFADKILKAIEALNMEHQENVASEYVTVSGGLVVQKGLEIEEKTSIYKLADSRLYKAKNSGRNRFC